MQIPHHCTLCPRACGADRAAGQRGFCGADNTLRVARAALHHWEEPCLSGDPNAETGSGTVFFSGCTLKCCYCQNYPISQGEVGKAISTQIQRIYSPEKHPRSASANSLCRTAGRKM